MKQRVLNLLSIGLGSGMKSEHQKLYLERITYATAAIAVNQNKEYAKLFLLIKNDFRV